MDSRGLAKDVVETALGQAAGQRHLAALKPDADAAAGTGLLALVATAAGLAVAGTGAAALAVGLLVGAGCGREFMQIHFSAPPSLVFLGDLKQVADVGDLAPGSRVVGLHGGVADLTEAQGLGSRHDAWRCGRSGS